MSLADIISKKNAVPAAAVPGAVVPVAAVPAAIAPVAVAPVAVAPVAAVGAVIPGAAPAPLGGGSRLEGVREALATVTANNQSNKIPSGTGSFLLKSGTFKLTGGGNHKLTSFELMCLIPGVDANGLSYGTAGYSGAMIGETYEEAIFLDMGPQAKKRTLSAMVSALSSCMGWDDAQLKAYQATPEGIEQLAQLLMGMFCVNIDTLVPTQQPCCFSNQVVVSLTSKQTRSHRKDKITKQPMYDANQQPIIGEYHNIYWDKKVSLAEVHAALGDAGVSEDFGSGEAWNAAVQMEQSLAAK